MSTNTLSPQQKTPISIEVDLKQHEVRIRWADGHNSGIYTFEFLRHRSSPINY